MNFISHVRVFDMTHKLISIHLPSNKPIQFERMVRSFHEKARNKNCFEIVVKTDVGDNEMFQVVERLKSNLGVTIINLITPPPVDYFGLTETLNEILIKSDPKAYFCWHVNDEIIIELDEWDVYLNKFVSFFPDNLFRLKVDRKKMFRNFFDLYEVNIYGDYSIVTRRWLELSEVWARGHGAEPYQEAISFMLAKRGINRNIPLLDLVISGDPPQSNISLEELRSRISKYVYYWDKNMEIEIQENVLRAARKIELAIVAERLNLKTYKIIDYPKYRRIVLLNSKDEILTVVWYHVNELLNYFWRLDGTIRRMYNTWPYTIWDIPIISPEHGIRHNFYNVFFKKTLLYRISVYVLLLMQLIFMLSCFVIIFPFLGVIGFHIRSRYDEIWYKTKLRLKKIRKNKPTKYPGKNNPL